MKRWFVCFFLLIAGINMTAFGQSEGKELSILKGTKVFNYHFYCDSIEGQDAKDFIAAQMKDEEETPQYLFDKYMNRMELSFLTGIKMSWFNRHGYTLDNSEKQKCEIIFSFSNVKANSSHTITAAIINSETKQGIVKKRIYQSGRKKSKDNFRNVFLEILTESGESIGDALSNIMEKVNKQ